MHNRDMHLTLGGISFRVKYEAENLYELSAITGQPWFQFIQSIQPRRGESSSSAAARCADISMLAPLIMAGLAHLDEYGGLSHRDLRRRVCQLLDKEAERRKEPLIAVCADIFAKLLPFIAQTMVPPGTDLDALAGAESDGNKKKGPSSKARKKSASAD